MLLPNFYYDPLLLVEWEPIGLTELTFPCKNSSTSLLKFS